MKKTTFFTRTDSLPEGSFRLNEISRETFFILVSYEKKSGETKKKGKKVFSKRFFFLALEKNCLKKGSCEVFFHLVSYEI